MATLRRRSMPPRRLPPRKRTRLSASAVQPLARWRRRIRMTRSRIATQSAWSDPPRSIRQPPIAATARNRLPSPARRCELTASGRAAMTRFPTIRAILALLLTWLGAVAASAQVLPEGPILAAADLRESQSLDGTWTYSIDPYRDGAAGFHGEPAGRGHRRWDDLDVEQARAADPLALFEYDMDTAPRAKLPASWLTHAPEMRHYQGLVWYQHRFDAAPQPGMRYFVRFGAANYAAEAWLNGQRLGRHEGGFTPFAFEVTGLLRESGNRLVVGVDSAHTERTVPPPVTDWETYGGITRSVRLIAVPEIG